MARYQVHIFIALIFGTVCAADRVLGDDKSIILGHARGSASLQPDADSIRHSLEHRPPKLQINPLADLRDGEAPQPQHQGEQWSLFASFAEPCHFPHPTGELDRALIIREEMHVAVSDEGEYVISFIMLPPAQDVTLRMTLTFYEVLIGEEGYPVRSATISVGPEFLPVSSAADRGQSRAMLVRQTGHSHALQELVNRCGRGTYGQQLGASSGGRDSSETPTCRISIRRSGNVRFQPQQNRGNALTGGGTDRE